LESTVIRFLAQKALEALFTLFLVSILVFMAGRIVGDPLDLYLPPNASAEQEEFVRSELGLDRPLPTQYANFAFDAIRGDLGDSIQNSKSVRTTILEVLPRSLQLAGVSLVFAFAIGVPLGVVAATRRDSIWDYLARFLSVIGQSVPSFTIALMLMLVMGVHLGVLPTSGTGTWKHFILPGFTMGMILAGSVTRLVRSSMLEVLSSDYITMHRIKGLPERSVVWKHGLRNASVGVIGFAGVYFVILITNAVVVETVFAWPGFGRLAYQSVLNRDYPVMQGAVLVGAFLYVLSSFVADGLTILANPRLRSRSS
jgi:peptide/nickel transport system permease protein